MERGLPHYLSYLTLPSVLARTTLSMGRGSLANMGANSRKRKEGRKRESGRKTKKRMQLMGAGRNGRRGGNWGGTLETCTPFRCAVLLGRTVEKVSFRALWDSRNLQPAA